MKPSYDSEFWEPEDELAPSGRPAELIHLALTGNGGWGLGVSDACGMRNAMRECGDEPPVGDRQWLLDLEMLMKLANGQDKLQDLARRIAWRAYAQGIVHGEEMLKHRLNTLLGDD
jgi:hypothetical protein